MDDSLLTASDLKIDLKSGEEKEIFGWFLASYLLGKRIQQDVAARTWRVFKKAGITSPYKIRSKSWQELVDLLGRGHYTHYDESMASNLLEMADFLIKNYRGKITGIHKIAEDRSDFMKKLQEIKGVGPKTTEIFLREVEELWFKNPKS